jgi:hypothetical protein
VSLTSELAILRKTVLRRERFLSVPGEVLVKVGQDVNPDTVIAKAELLPGDPYVVDLRTELKRPLVGAQVQQVMTKWVGDRVKAGEIIAELPQGIFKEVRQVRSPVDGVIEFVSRSYARVLIREDPRSAMPVAVVPVAKQLDVWPGSMRMYMRYREGDEVKQGAALADSPGFTGYDYSYAPISGIIEKIDTRAGTVTIVRPAKPTLVEAYLLGQVDSGVPEYGAVVSCEAAYVQGIFGVGFETYGHLTIVASDPSAEVDASDLSDEMRDQVIVAGSRITLDAVRKAAAGGARGIIAGGMDQMDLVSFVGSEIGAGITGQEDIPLTIVLTEGFGKMPMADWTFDLLREHQGKVVALNGSTQVRAGVIRPEVVIPLGPAPAGADSDEGRKATKRVDVAVGGRVRVLRKPYFGLWGMVTELPTQLQQLETEASVRVVKVKLQDGREVLVPEANVEAF